METSATPHTTVQPSTSFASRINARAVVKSVHGDGGKPVIGAIREIKTKRVYEAGAWQPAEWLHMDIPGVGMRWVPASYFIAYAW